MHSIAFLSFENKASICFVLDCIIPWQILWSIVILHCCNIETLHPLTCAPELIALKFPKELLQWKINRNSKTSSVIRIVRIMSCVYYGSCNSPAKLLHIGVFIYRRSHIVPLFFLINWIFAQRVKYGFQWVVKWYYSNRAVVLFMVKLLELKGCFSYFQFLIHPSYLFLWASIFSTSVMFLSLVKKCI